MVFNTNTAPFESVASVAGLSGDYEGWADCRRQGTVETFWRYNKLGRVTCLGDKS